MVIMKRKCKLCGDIIKGHGYEIKNLSEKHLKYIHKAINKGVDVKGFKEKF